MTIGTDSAEFQICHSTNAQDMLFQRQSLVETTPDTTVVNRERKGNIDLTDLHIMRDRTMLLKLFRCSKRKFLDVVSDWLNFLYKPIQNRVG